MPITNEQIIENNKATAEAVAGISTKAASGVERIIELNVAASKANMEESKANISEAFGHIQGILSASDAQELIALRSKMFQPLAQKYLSYSTHLYTIATETGAEMMRGLTSVAENAMKTLPVGTDTTMAFFKNAVDASQKAVEAAQNTAQKAVDLTASNMTTAAHQASQVNQAAHNAVQRTTEAAESNMSAAANQAAQNAKMAARKSDGGSARTN